MKNLQDDRQRGRDVVRTGESVFCWCVWGGVGGLQENQGGGGRKGVLHTKGFFFLLLGQVSERYRS